MTPLLTGFVADEKASAEFAVKRKSFEEMYPFMKNGIGNMEKAAHWYCVLFIVPFYNWKFSLVLFRIQGPVDKYGLALYLGSRLSGVTTVVSVTLLAQYVSLDNEHSFMPFASLTQFCFIRFQISSGMRRAWAVGRLWLPGNPTFSIGLLLCFTMHINFLRCCL